MFGAGIGMLLFVPIFKTVTHLPPYMGMLLALGVVWVVSEILHSKKTKKTEAFYGQSCVEQIAHQQYFILYGHTSCHWCAGSNARLTNLAAWMNDTIGNLDAIVFIIGIASAVIDNVSP